MKIYLSKISSGLLLVASFLCTNGCMTANVVYHAKGTSTGTFFNPRQKAAFDITETTAKPNPSYYYLLPLTIPADASIFPIELIGSYIEHYPIHVE